MTKTLIGIDYLGVACVKIAKGSLDPVTTPDSQVSAWLYNSKWSKDVNVKGSNTLPFYASTTNGGSFYAYNQSGANGSCDYYVSTSYLGTSLYALPLFDYKEVHWQTKRFQQGKTLQSTVGYGDRGGRWSSGGYYGGGWFLNFVKNPDFNVPSYPSTGVFRGRGSDLDEAPGVTPSLVMWALPGDEAAILDGAPQAAIPGQPSILINSATCRVAKPGFNVYTATETQLAFDSAKRPPKVIAAADIAIPSGPSSYDTGISLPAGAVPDVYFYTAGDALYFPTNPTQFQQGAEYWLSGSTIQFNNPNGPCRVRFIIIAGANEAPTFGANDVLRQFVEGGQNVVQFLRPGSGPNPSFNDIILDSRWPSLQILAEGYIAVGAGAQQHVVPINGAGVFPIVKYMTVHGGGGDGYGTWSKSIRTPKTAQIGLFRTGWKDIQDAGDSTYCRVTSSEARFYTFQGSPTLKYYNNVQAFDQDSPSYEYDATPIIGIRYYVLGIPA